MPDIDVSDVEKALVFLVPPERPADDADDAGEINARIDRIEALDDRLSGLFEDDSWVALDKKSELKGYLSEWIISAKDIETFNSNLSDDNTFLTWLEEEVTKWENGEKVPQPNPSADPVRPWTAWYKYDTEDQEYYYAESQHSDDWRTWDEWEPEGSADVQQAAEPVAEGGPPAVAAEAATFATTEEAQEGAALVTSLAQKTLTQAVTSLPAEVVAALSLAELENLAVEANKAAAGQN
ncbi:MAG TPA: hypothetical protein VKS82_05145 [Streptosporangiaceae bacterium]|nr:hypothetical protein [Streptosporangiaceae bacterium]